MAAVEADIYKLDIASSLSAVIHVEFRLVPHEKVDNVGNIFRPWQFVGHDLGMKRRNKSS